MPIQLPINPAWKALIQDWTDTPQYRELQHYLEQRTLITRIYPDPWNTYRAFDFVSPRAVKVVILGQDPYHREGQAHGLAFSVPSGYSPLPASLNNIFKAIRADLGIKNTRGCLYNWAYQGVLLLNTILTVEKGKPMSHADRGWEDLIACVLHYLSSLDQPIVYMLWGEGAKSYVPLISGNKKQLILETSHPSPMSVSKGFMFCKHFSKANEFLSNNGRTPIDWRT